MPDRTHTAVSDACTAIERRLLRFRRSDALLRALSACAGIGLYLVIISTALLGLEAAFYLAPSAKAGILGVGLLVLLVAVGKLVAAPLLRPPSLVRLARQVSLPHGGLNQQLESAIELWQRRSADNAAESSDLADAAILQAETASRQIDFSLALDHATPARRARDLGFALAVCAAVCVAFAAPLGEAAQRLSNPLTPYTRPPETHLVVAPGAARLVEGDAFDVTARISGVVPLEAELYLRESGVTSWSRVPLSVRRDTVTYRIDPVRRPFEYRVAAHDAESATYAVAVRPRPVVKRVEHHYDYPAYTGMPDRKDESGGDVVAPRGTIVDLFIQASLPLSRAWVAFENETRIEAGVSGAAANTRLGVDVADRFTIGLADTGGILSRSPVEYRIVALSDDAPETRILRPGADGEIGERMRQPLVIEALDDFGVARAELRYRLNENPEEAIVPVPLDSAGARSLTQRFIWDLAQMDLLPGDVIRYRARAYDANTVTGPSYGESTEFTLRFPSLHEIHEAAMQEQDDDLDAMEETREAGRDLRERLEDVARDLLREGDLSWEGRQQIESAVVEQEALSERIQETARALEETLDRLEQSGLMAEETLQKIDEVRDLLASIDSPELQAAMQELRDALSQPDPEALREALSQFTEQQEAFQKGLDRAIQLLERVRNQQMLDALAQRLSALAEEQKALRESTEEAETDLGAAADRQERLGREAAGLAESLDRAAESLDDPTRSEVAEIADDLDKVEAPAEMSEIADALRGDRESEANNQSRSLERELGSLADRMAQVRDAFAQDQKAEVLRDLSGLLQGLITLSRAQENTADEAARSRTGPPDEGLSGEQARNLSAAARMADRLLSASNKTFLLPPEAGASLGRALNKMAEAAGHLQNGSGPRAGSSAREAMAGLNAAALAVRQAMANVRSSESGTGFGEMLARMQQLSEGQGQLNGQTEGLFGQQQRPGGVSPSLQNAIQRMASEQSALREMLEKIREELSGTQGEVLGDLGRVSGDMDAVSKELGRRQLTPETVERQRRILSRLLDAQRSMREQGRSRQREARSGGTFAYRGPGSLPASLGERPHPLRERLRQALRDGYGPEYQELIRRYFDLLMEDASQPAVKPEGK